MPGAGLRGSLPIRAPPTCMEAQSSSFLLPKGMLAAGPLGPFPSFLFQVLTRKQQPYL